MCLIDSHAHLTDPVFSGRIEEIRRTARGAGVRQIITVATSLADAHPALNLAANHPDVFAAVGIHPHQTARAADGDLDSLASVARHDRVVALGEIGLDYHYDFSDRPTQQRMFERQLNLAADLALPLVMHCRQAHHDVVARLRDHGFVGKRVVFHCFTGGAAEAEEIAECGWRISFTGVVTFRRSTALQGIARTYPADELMLETDSPYLSPEPVRRVRPNQPAHLRHIAEFLARLRQVDPETLAEQTAANTRAFFGLP